MEKVVNIEYRYWTEGEGYSHSELRGQFASTEEGTTAEQYIEACKANGEDFTDEWWHGDAALERVDGIEVIIRDAETNEILDSAWAYK